MNIEATYRPNIFSSVEDMDTAVSNHIYHSTEQLPVSNRKILRVIAAHAFSPIGTAHLKVATIAQEAGCSPTTVSRAIKRLKELKILHVQQGTKLNGIQGANIYCILPFSSIVKERVREREMIERVTHGTPRSSKAQGTKNQTETCISFNLSSKPFVVSNVNTYSAPAMYGDLKRQLQAIYQPTSVEEKRAFEELCKIAFGRLKQYMYSHSVPYLQLEQIVLKAMHDLVRKQNVNNQFAMYSSMIKRQVEQLFEAPVKPVQAFNQSSREIVPDWFETRHTTAGGDVTSPQLTINYEAEKARILQKLNA